MNQSLTHFALAALLTVGLMGCAAGSPSSTTEPRGPVFQSQSPVTEGQVVRNEDSAYVIRELSGRLTRVVFDRKTVRDNIAVGDTVVARFDGPPSSASATSITRGTGKPAPPSANASPRFQTVEGIVQQQDGNDYVVKENSGRDVRLHVDNTSRLDRDIRTGDRVVVITSTMPSDAPYVTTMYRLDSPYVVQGEVVWADENGNVVRDFMGRDVRLQSNSATVRNDNIRMGDRIIADTGSSSSVHVDSIAKR